MWKNISSAGGIYIAGMRDVNQADVKMISTVEEFGDFLKENGARIDQSVRSLSLYICGSGSVKTGSQLWTKPDPTTEICVYVQSNEMNCGIDFYLPKSIVIRAPRSTVEIPSALLTKEMILSAYAKSGLSSTL